MADGAAGERTEKPTAERLRKARLEGKVPQSNELPSAVMVVCMLLSLALALPWLCQWMVAQLQAGLSYGLRVPLNIASFTEVLKDRAGDGLLHVSPFLLAACVASVMGSLLISGWSVSPKAVGFDLKKIGFGGGLKQLFSVGSVATIATALAKMFLLTWIIYAYLRDRFPQVLGMSWSGPQALLGQVGRLVLGVTVRIAIALAVIALADVIFQRWKYFRELRMTKQEVIEERKQYELSPQIRGRIRGIQIEMSRRRMLQDVPTADVVIVNPTHVAVALKYDSLHMQSPQVVAKGADFICEKIKEVARAHEVPIVERPELARALYANVDVGQNVPQTLFVAVAEVLAMIYRLRSSRSGVS